MITMIEAKQSGRIPEAWHDSFNDKCQECGSDILISENLRTMTCSNIRCLRKLANRAANMLSNLGVTGVGEATCYKLLKHNWDSNKLKSHLDIFRYTTNELPVEMLGASGYSALQSIRTAFDKQYTFPELLSLLAFPALKTTFLNLFDGCQDFAHYKRVIDNHGGEEYFLIENGIYDKTKIKALCEFEKDMLYANIIFSNNLKQRADKKILVYVTGFIFPEGKRMTKTAFRDYCNSLCEEDGKRYFEIEYSSAFERLNYVISDADPNLPGSNHHNKGRQLGKLISSTDFLAWLREQVNIAKGVKENNESAFK